MNDGSIIENAILTELQLALPKGYIKKLAKLNVSPAEGSHAAALEYLAEVGFQLMDARGYSVVGTGEERFSRFIAYGPKRSGRHEGHLVVLAVVRVGTDELLVKLQHGLGFVDRDQLLRWLIENVLPVAKQLKEGKELLINFRGGEYRKLIAPHVVES